MFILTQRLSQSLTGHLATNPQIQFKFTFGLIATGPGYLTLKKMGETDQNHTWETFFSPSLYMSKNLRLPQKFPVSHHLINGRFTQSSHLPESILGVH